MLGMLAVDVKLDDKDAEVDVDVEVEVPDERGVASRESVRPRPESCCVRLPDKSRRSDEEADDRNTPEPALECDPCPARCWPFALDPEPKPKPGRNGVDGRSTIGCVR